MDKTNGKEQMTMDNASTETMRDEADYSYAYRKYRTSATVVYKGGDILFVLPGHCDRQMILRVLHIRCGAYQQGMAAGRSEIGDEEVLAAEVKRLAAEVRDLEAQSRADSEQWAAEREDYRAQIEDRKKRYREVVRAAGFIGDTSEHREVMEWAADLKEEVQSLRAVAPVKATAREVPKSDYAAYPCCGHEHRWIPGASRWVCTVHDCRCVASSLDDLEQRRKGTPKVR